MGKTARGGPDGKLYTTGDILNSDLENIGSTDGQQTVGNFPPNAFGLYDMGETYKSGVGTGS